MEATQPTQPERARIDIHEAERIAVDVLAEIVKGRSISPERLDAAKTILQHAREA